MPNFCENKLVLQGTESQILAFEARYFVEVTNQALNKEGQVVETKDLEFSFDRVKPIPSELKPPNDGWYDWCIENWGTKWDVCHFRRGDKPGSYFFDTAWSFPQQLFDELTTQLTNDFTGLYFDGYFFEVGMGFCGHFYYNDNEGFESHFNEDPSYLRAIAKEHFDYDPYEDEDDESDDDDAEVQSEDESESAECHQAEDQLNLNRLVSEVSVLLKCIKFY
jgi:hypothetical protein